MDPGEDEPSREELESRVDQLEQTVSKMLPDRRGVLKGLGAAAIGGAAVGASSGGAAGQSAAGQVGTESEPVDVEAASVGAQSVSTNVLDNAPRAGEFGNGTLQDALDEAAPWGTVIIPDNSTVEVNSPTTYGNHISIVGYGYDSVIKSNITNGSDVLTGSVQNLSELSFRNFRIEGTGSEGDGLVLNGSIGRNDIRNVYVGTETSVGGSGITLRSSLNTLVDNCYVQNATNGLLLDRQNGGTTISVKDSTFRSCGRGVRVKSGSTDPYKGLFFERCLFESNQNAGIYSGSDKRTAVRNCWFENNNTSGGSEDAHIVFEFGGNRWLRNNNFSAAGDISDAVRFPISSNNNRGLVIEDNVLNFLDIDLDGVTPISNNNLLTWVGRNIAPGTIKNASEYIDTNSYEGREAAGTGNSPAGEWPTGMLVENTDDNTVWILDSTDSWRQVV